MSAAKWKDVSSWARSDTAAVRAVPNSWLLEVADMCIRVHRHIHHPPDVWLASCYEVSVDSRPLKSKDIDAAKAEAIGVVFAIMSRRMTALAALVKP